MILRIWKSGRWAIHLSVVPLALALVAFSTDNRRGVLVWTAEVRPSSPPRNSLAEVLGLTELKGGDTLLVARGGPEVSVTILDRLGVPNSANLPRGWAEPFAADETGALFAVRSAEPGRAELMRFDGRTADPVWLQPTLLTAALSEGGVVDGISIDPQGDLFISIGVLGFRDRIGWELSKVDGTSGEMLWSLCAPPEANPKLGAASIKVDAEGNVLLLFTAPTPEGGSAWAILKVSGVDGRRLWGPILVAGDQDRPSAPADLGIDSRGDVLATGEVVADGSCRWVAMKLDGKSGRTLWGPTYHGFTESWGGPRHPESVRLDVRGDLFVSSRFTPVEIAKIDGTSGRLLWLADSPLNRAVQTWRPDAKGNLLVAGTNTERSDHTWVTWQLDGSTGQRAWEAPFTTEAHKASRPATILDLQRGRILVAGVRTDITTAPYRWIGRVAIQSIDSSTGESLDPVLLPEGRGVQQDRPLAALRDPQGDIVTATIEGRVTKFEASSGQIIWGPLEILGREEEGSVQGIVVDEVGDVSLTGTKREGGSHLAWTLKVEGRTGGVRWRTDPIAGASGAGLVLGEEGDLLELGDVDVSDEKRPSVSEDDEPAEPSRQRTVVRSRNGSNGELRWTSAPLSHSTSDAISITRDSSGHALAIVKAKSESLAISFAAGGLIRTIWSLGSAQVVSAFHDREGHVFVLSMIWGSPRRWICTAYNIADGRVLWTRTEKPQHVNSQLIGYAASIDYSGDLVVAGRFDEYQAGSGWRVVKYCGSTGDVLWRSDPISLQSGPRWRYSLPTALTTDADDNVLVTGSYGPSLGSAGIVLKLSASSGERLWACPTDIRPTSAAVSFTTLRSVARELWLFGSVGDGSALSRFTEDFAVGSSGERLPAAIVGRRYQASLEPANGLPPYSATLASGTIPKGIAVGSDGVLRGLPRASGTFRFVLNVKDRARSIRREYVLNVHDLRNGRRSSRTDWARSRFEKFVPACEVGDR